MTEQIKLNFIPFKKGQMVWLDTRHLKMNYHKKMAPKREGPFEIEDVLGLVTYQLKLPESWKIQYLVKWAGYLITEASWEPRSSFTGSAEILQEYQEHHQL